MGGSPWTRSRAATDTVCFNAFKKIVRHRPAQEKKQLFHDTAERVFRL